MDVIIYLKSKIISLKKNILSNIYIKENYPNLNCPPPDLKEIIEKKINKIQTIEKLGNYQQKMDTQYRTSMEVINELTIEEAQESEDDDLPKPRSPLQSLKTTNKALSLPFKNSYPNNNEPVSSFNKKDEKLIQNLTSFENRENQENDNKNNKEKLIINDMQAKPNTSSIIKNQILKNLYNNRSEKAAKNKENEQINTCQENTEINTKVNTNMNSNQKMQFLLNEIEKLNLENSKMSSRLKVIGKQVNDLETNWSNPINSNCKNEIDYHLVSPLVEKALKDYMEKNQSIQNLVTDTQRINKNIDLINSKIGIIEENTLIDLNKKYEINSNQLNDIDKKSKENEDRIIKIEDEIKIAKNNKKPIIPGAESTIQGIKTKAKHFDIKLEDLKQQTSKDKRVFDTIIKALQDRIDYIEIEFRNKNKDKEGKKEIFNPKKNPEEEVVCGNEQASSELTMKISGIEKSFSNKINELALQIKEVKEDCYSKIGKLEMTINEKYSQELMKSISEINRKLLQFDNDFKTTNQQYNKLFEIFEILDEKVKNVLNKRYNFCFENQDTLNLEKYSKIKEIAQFSENINDLRFKSVRNSAIALDPKEKEIVIQNRSPFSERVSQDKNSFSINNFKSNLLTSDQNINDIPLDKANQISNDVQIKELSKSVALYSMKEMKFTKEPNKFECQENECQKFNCTAFSQSQTNNSLSQNQLQPSKELLSFLKMKGIKIEKN